MLLFNTRTAHHGLCEAVGFMKSIIDVREQLAVYRATAQHNSIDAEIVSPIRGVAPSLTDLGCSYKSGLIVTYIHYCI